MNPMVHFRFLLKKSKPDQHFKIDTWKNIYQEPYGWRQLFLLLFCSNPDNLLCSRPLQEIILKTAREQMQQAVVRIQQQPDSDNAR